MPTLGQATLRHATYYGVIAHSADTLFRKGGGDLERGLALFDDERANIESAFSSLLGTFENDSAPRIGWPDLAPRKVEAARGILRLALLAGRIGGLRFHPRLQRLRWLNAQLASARYLGDKQAESIALGNLGITHHSVGNAQQALAYQNERLRLTIEIGDRLGQGQALGNIGLVHFSLGDIHQAIAYHEKFLAIARELAEPVSEGQALGNLGSSYYRLGDYRRAILFATRRLEVVRGAGDILGESQAHGEIGVAKAELGSYREAMDHQRQALELSRHIGDIRGEAIALGCMGNILIELGRPVEAVAEFDRSIILAHELDDRRVEGNGLWNSARAWKLIGNGVEVNRRAEAALRIYATIEDPMAQTVRAFLKSQERGSQ
jgi:tetratricopeptide (TPR) repeat protein